MISASIKSLARSKPALSGMALLLSVLLFFGSGAKIPWLEHKTDDYFSSAITKAGLAYATCRIVNASVSILKESSLQLEPAGIGVSLALGQALDPIDDMTERLSDVLVTAITALGVQKMVYEISQALILPILSGLLILMAFLIWLNTEKARRIKQILTGLIFIAAIVRCTFPFSALASSFLQDHFFNDRIQAANHALSTCVGPLDSLKEISLPEIDGVKQTIENSFQFLKDKTRALNLAVAEFSRNMGEIIQTLLTLTFLYVAFFFIQVLLLPVLTFWILAKVTRVFLPTPN